MVVVIGSLYRVGSKGSMVPEKAISFVGYATNFAFRYTHSYLFQSRSFLFDISLIQSLRQVTNWF